MHLFPVPDPTTLHVKKLERDNSLIRERERGSYDISKLLMEMYVMDYCQLKYEGKFELRIFKSVSLQSY